MGGGGSGSGLTALQRARRVADLARMNVTGALNAIARAKSRSDERRGNGRFGVEDLKSNLGPVIDLSGRGARIVTKFRWDEGEGREVTLRGTHMSVTIHARCVWARKEGWRRYVVGVAFEDCTPEQRTVLGELARRYTTRSWGKPFESADRRDSTLIPLQTEQKGSATNARPSGDEEPGVRADAA